MSVARKQDAGAMIFIAVAASLAAGAGAAWSAPAAERAPLVARCLEMSGAGRAVCRQAPGARVSVAGQPEARAERFGGADLAGGYTLYRLMSETRDYRRCRLQPTCSLFAAQAARRFGLLRGLLMGLARAQMSHSDQGGWLPRAVASDGEFIFLDPVERWLHGPL